MPTISTTCWRSSTRPCGGRAGVTWQNPYAGVGATRWWMSFRIRIGLSGRSFVRRSSIGSRRRRAASFSSLAIRSNPSTAFVAPTWIPTSARWMRSPLLEVASYRSIETIGRRPHWSSRPPQSSIKRPPTRSSQARSPMPRFAARAPIVSSSTETAGQSRRFIWCPSSENFHCRCSVESLRARSEA